MMAWWSGRGGSPDERTVSDKQLEALGPIDNNT